MTKKRIDPGQFLPPSHEPPTFDEVFEEFVKLFGEKYGLELKGDSNDLTDESNRESLRGFGAPIRTPPPSTPLTLKENIRAEALEFFIQHTMRFTNGVFKINHHKTEVASMVIREILDEERKLQGEDDDAKLTEVEENLVSALEQALKAYGLDKHLPSKGKNR